jgi:hypothetical protein
MLNITQLMKVKLSVQLCVNKVAKCKQISILTSMKHTQSLNTCPMSILLKIVNRYQKLEVVPGKEITFFYINEPLKQYSIYNYTTVLLFQGLIP